MFEKKHEIAWRFNCSKYTVYVLWTILSFLSYARRYYNRKNSYAELYFVDKCFNNIDTLPQQCYSDGLISVKISLIGYIKNDTITSLFFSYSSSEQYVIPLCKGGWVGWQIRHRWFDVQGKGRAGGVVPL